ncbi:unnamed protein product [Candida verbasci]|uniref:FAD dependent oxidoreductase domain-containing protein n=1 Tax=Candida verbasci TaxID=1227364 RepID=A0A9W4TT38_9ASCO|nr:unnamed protein product [Candida verbasci]
MTDNYLQFLSKPSGNHKDKHHIIIVGAGIIGVCTAYYIVCHPKFDYKKYYITIIESKRVAGGASGKAGGLLALWAFPEQIVQLSFDLHQQLADKYNGYEEWGYRRLTTVSLEGDISDTTKKRTKKKHNNLPSELNWITSNFIDNCSELGGTDTTAQVHPYKFTNFILKKAVEYSKGSLELILGKVDEITYSVETGSATGVKFQTKNEEIIELKSDQIVLSVGPWTSKILPDCPISGLRAHSITIAPFKDQVSPYAIFTEFKIGPTSYISPEIYARQDEVYVCGEGDSAVDVPETTDDVEVVKSKCDELFEQVGKVSPNLKNGHILKRQACYLPVLDVPSSSGPLIGETNVSNLYLASGHSCWGINNAPGTGKIMSELLFGDVESADISSLDPSLYFDASVLEEL